VHRCGLLLQMSHVAWSVCLSSCVLVTRMYCAKTAEPIEIPFGGLTQLGPISHYWIESSRSPTGRGNFGVVRPTRKHWKSLLRFVQQRDHSLVNNSMTVGLLQPSTIAPD